MADRSTSCHPDRPYRAMGKCRACYQRDYRASKPEKDRAYGDAYSKQRKLRIDALKANPCVDCGGIFHPAAMDFDHVRGQKVAQIGNMRSWSMERVLEEISKCELVCANCHRVRTHTRNQYNSGRLGDKDGG